MVRPARFDRNGVRTGAWSREEDDKLRDYIEKHGRWNWRLLPKYAGLSRCGKSCRLRWMNYLRPDLKRGNYTKEEDDLIIKLREKLGNRWSKIAAELPGRTDNEIKNRWHSHLKKRNSGASKQEASEIKRDDIGTTLRVENSLSPPILESNPFSPMPNNKELLSPLASDPAIVAAASSTTTDFSTERYDETGGDDFWTQAFVADRDFPTTPSLEDEQILSSYIKYHEDSLDLLYDVTQEFSAILTSSSNCY